MAVSSLNQSKTPGIILAEIKMMSTTFAGVHFLVEGDQDAQFWKRHVSAKSVSVVICEGKLNLLGAGQLIKNNKISSVVGVYDPDFEKLSGITHCPDMLVPTDQNDLELTLVASEALNQVLHEFAEPKKIAEFEKIRQLTVAQHLEQTSREFGKLRYLNGLLFHNVAFKSLSPYRFISLDDWSLDREALLLEYSKLSHLPVLQLEELVRLNCPDASYWQLSQGHDALKILAQGLRCCIGKEHNMDDQMLAKLLRLAFSSQLLQQTEMYKKLCAIQTKLPTPLFS